MPYIDRNEAGHIVGICNLQQREGQEFVESAELYSPADPPDLIAEAKANILALEAGQIRMMARMTRELTLADAEARALAQYGLTAEQLYAAGKAPDAPIAAFNYAKLKDIDNAIKVEREKFS